jgi:integrase
VYVNVFLLTNFQRLFYPRWEMSWLRYLLGPSTEAILEEMLGELAGLQRSEVHIYGLRNSLARFVEEFPRLGGVKERDIARHLSSLKVGQRRRDNILCAIIQLSRFARRRNYLPEDRRSAAEKVQRIRSGHDITTWTPAEARLLLEHVSPRWLPCLAIGLFAGLRTSEILRLDWGAFKWELQDHEDRPAPVIAVNGKVARKTRVSRLVPMQPNLVTWLEPYRDRVGPLYPGNFKTNENARCLETARLRRATGAARKDNALRHSFGSYRLAVTRDYKLVADEMGNSPRMIRESYNDPKPKGEGEAYFRLARPDFAKVIPMSLDLEFH